MDEKFFKIPKTGEIEMTQKTAEKFEITALPGFESRQPYVPGFESRQPYVLGFKSRQPFELRVKSRQLLFIYGLDCIYIGYAHRMTARQVSIY